MSGLLALLTGRRVTGRRVAGKIKPVLVGNIGQCGTAAAVNKRWYQVEELKYGIAGHCPFRRTASV